MYVNGEDGKKIGMPRYYKLKLYNDEEKERIAKNVRVKLAEKILEDLFKYSEMELKDIREDRLESRWRQKELHDRETKLVKRKKFEYAKN